MMAKKKPIDIFAPDDLGVDVSNSMVSIKSHSSPPEKQPGQKFVGSDSIPQVVSKLREEANVI
jgi:electron transfer flavoprotein alpha/beta subunit